MQPLKTAVRPSSLSTIGWPPAVGRAMTDSRRGPNAARPALHEPWPSGPRGTSAQTIRSTAAVSAREPSKVMSPERPHMHPDLTPSGGGMRRVDADVTHLFHVERHDQLSSPWPVLAHLPA